MTKQANNIFNQLAEGSRQKPHPVATLFWTIVFGCVFATVGWNFGVSEVVQALGGPDGNINILEGGALFLAIALLRRAGASAA